jgi:hypothetical protein
LKVWQLFKSFNLAGRIGMVIGALGALAGAAVAIAAAPLVGTILVVVMISILVVGFWLAWRPQLRRNRLVKSGTAAQATILGIRETGWTVQGNYGQAELTLSVEPPDGGAPYEATTRALINRFDIPAWQPGARVEVVIDPDDPSVVAVV